MLTRILNLTGTAVIPELRQTYQGALTALLIVLFVLIAGVIVLLVIRSRARTASRRNLIHWLQVPVLVLAFIVFGFALFCANRLSSLDIQQPDPTESTQPSVTETSQPPTTEPTSEPTTEPTTEPTEPSLPGSAYHTDKTNPDNWGVDWEIIYNDSIVNAYQREETIHFGSSGVYFDFPGVSAFRGNHYRQGATYGTAAIKEEKLTRIWESEISSLPKSPSSGGVGYWTGAGWTGQPLVVEWDEETKQIMNLYPEKKAKAGLVEVIYPTLDGHVYFYDLETGEYTRDPLFLGMAFKGTGALDPRGYPILYVGSGDRDENWKAQRMFVVSLIDCSILYEKGHEDYFNLRSWRAYDSSPLIHAESDTLIWPGENGLLYTIKLNTQYDKAAGTISVNPDKPVMARYTTDLGRTLGYEASAAIVENYLYLGDNGGMMFCVDLNTMELKWAQFIRDDLNASPTFEWGEDGNGYLYVGTSMEYAEGTVYLYKLNALNGEIVWEKAITDVFYSSSVSGGVLSSPLLGQKGTDLEGLILFHVARTPNSDNGVLMALDCKTGEEVWTKAMDFYTWSSPVAFYTEDGRAYVVICDSNGYVNLLNSKTGETINRISIGANVEASPVIYKDTLVVGTRGMWVYGVKIT